MQTSFTIKNFRIFDGTGVTLDLKPITIITGANSAGKSSLVKAVFLLNSFIESLSQSMSRNGLQSPFSIPLSLDNAVLRLGNFNSALHKSSDRKNRTITIEYSTEVPITGKSFNVKLEFQSNTSDSLKRGRLKALTITDDNGEIVLYHNQGQDSIHFNLLPLKECYCKFAALSSWYLKYRLVHNYELLDNTVADATTIEQYKKDIDDFKKESKSSYTAKEKSIFNKWIRSVKLSLFDSIEVADREKSIKSFFRLPLFDLLKGIGCESSYAYFQQFLFQKGLRIPDALLKDFEIILNDAINKGFNSLESYFLNLEDSEGLRDDSCRLGQSFTSQWTAERGYKDDREHLFSGYLNELYGYFSLERELPFDAARPPLGFDSNFNEIKPSERELALYKEGKAQMDMALRQDVHFYFVHKTLSLLSAFIDERFSDNVDRWIGSFDTERIVFHEPSFDLFCQFATTVVQNALCPTETSFGGKMSYVSSDRSSIKRLYSLGEPSDSFGLLLKNYIDSMGTLSRRPVIKSNAKSKSKAFVPGSFISKWLDAFGIGKSISFESAAEGLGVIVVLHKHDGRRSLLADEGYGITQLISILMSIELGIRNKRHDGIYTIAIEEPEIHLHPGFQALLTDMFLDAYENYGVEFLIETHSEYLVRRSQVYVADRFKDLKSNPFAVFYFPKDNSAYEMRYTPDGHFEKSFGTGFFDAAATDVLKLSRLHRSGTHEQ